MKTLPLIMLAVFSSFFLFQCTKNSAKERTLLVKYNEWASTGEIQMQLTGEIDDSRCPVHPVDLYYCFWEGEASGFVKTEIRGTNHELPFTIKGLCDSSTDTCGTKLDTLGYLFQFVSLNPYPDGSAIDENDYVLNVKVVKK